MKNKLTGICAIAALLAATAVPALADRGNGFCSTSKLAGRWVFFTDVGQQSLGLGGDGDITALGTMNIDKKGNLSGKFDLTVADLLSTEFTPPVKYSGTVKVNADCTGRLEFVTEMGTQRTDSIAVLGRRVMRGMSLDPMNLWTYWVRRVPARAHDDD